MCPGAVPAARTTAAASRATTGCVGKERDGVEIALQSDTVADAATRGAKIHRPVEANALRAARRQRVEPLPASFGEDDRRNAASVGRGLQRREHRAHRAERVRAIGLRRQQAAPRVEEHDGVDAGPNLFVEVCDDGARIHRDQALQQVRPLVDHPAHRREIGAAGAFDHVARERERASGEPDQRDAARERSLDFANRIEDIRESSHVRNFERAQSRSRRQRARSNRGPSPSAK